ncbi:MAG: glycosyltransferase, partial [Candidatus Aureabacteria bacterium]|nr:glycosyltransferase [Candidatus Auribacterota bacterium]
MKISVIIPTHNRFDILQKCLLALEKQTLDHSFFEVLIGDDGSTDETEKALP